MTSPFVAAYSMAMLGWSVDGAQYSGQEVSAMLTDAGFTDVDVKSNLRVLQHRRRPKAVGATSAEGAAAPGMSAAMRTGPAC